MDLPTFFSPKVFVFPKVFQSLREVLLDQMPDCSRSVNSEAFCGTALMRKAVLQPQPHSKHQYFVYFS